MYVKRVPLIITLCIIVISIGGYFVYEKYFVETTTDLWDLVPQNTVAAYEASSCSACIEPVRQSPLWQIISRAAFYDKKQDSLQSLTDFLSTPKNGAVASMHITKKDDFDFVFYVPLHQKNEKAFLINAIEEWRKRKGFRFSEREFNGIKIQELATKGNVLSWILLDDAWVGSFTPFLIEDVIRTLNNKGETSFRSNMTEVYQLPYMKSDAGNVYVHLKNLSNWLTVFSADHETDILNSFGRACLLDVKQTDNNLILNGFTLDTHQSASLLSIFKNQSPVPFGLKTYVSNRSVIMIDYGISNGEKFGQELAAYSLRKRTQLNDTLTKLSQSLRFSSSELYKEIGDEVGVCYVESKGQQLSKILIIETKNPDKWMQQLNSLAEQLSADTIFFERYADYEIRELPLHKFPEKILWPLVSGFKQCYFTSLGNTFFLGEELEELKKFIEDIDREDTWGKSVNQNRFLGTTLLESNISLFINSSRVWNILGSSLQPKWIRFVYDNQSLLGSLGMGAIQFSHLNESFYTNATWMYNQQQLAGAAPAIRNERLITNFENAVISQPFIVRSHVDKSDEVLIQDSTYNIQLVSSGGKILWKLPLKGPIIDDVKQIDFFNNGKLQYFFVTNGELHVIDRLGNYVEPFPLSLPASDIEYASVIDYDHSKKYRFLIADKSGKLWMYDKQGNNLEGWMPRNVEGGLFTAPQHHRIRGRDYLLAMRRDGMIYLMNRRGENLKGFPLKLDARPTGDYYLETGSDMATTYFVIVSRDGFRIKFNLEGKVQSRETLLKTSIESQFSLIREKAGKSYVIVRQDNKRLSLLNEEGKEILSNDYLGFNKVVIQFFDFGAGELVYVITDTVQDLTFLYNRNGDLMTSTPLESYAVSLRASDAHRIKTYTTYQNSLIVQHP